MDGSSSQDLRPLHGYDSVETHASLRSRHLAIFHAYILASTERRPYYRKSPASSPENPRRRIRDCQKAEPARTRGAKPRNRPCLTITGRSRDLGQGMGPSTLTLASKSPEQLPPSISPQQQKKLTHPSTTLKLFPRSTTVQAIQSQYTKPVLPTRSKQPPKRTHSSSLSKSPPSLQEPHQRSIPLIQYFHLQKVLPAKPAL